MLSSQIIHANSKTLKSRRHFYESTFIFKSCSGWLKISVLATVSVWQFSGVSMTGYEDDGWQRVHYKNHLKQSVRCLIFALQGWRINPFEFSNIVTLNSVVSPQVLNKYLILVDVKSRRFMYESGRVGDEAKNKSPAKARELTSMTNLMYIFLSTKK